MSRWPISGSSSVYWSIKIYPSYSEYPSKNRFLPYASKSKYLIKMVRSPCKNSCVFYILASKICFRIISSSEISLIWFLKSFECFGKIISIVWPIDNLCTVDMKSFSTIVIHFRSGFNIFECVFMKTWLTDQRIRDILPVVPPCFILHPYHRQLRNIWTHLREYLIHWSAYPGYSPNLETLILARIRFFFSW